VTVFFGAAACLTALAVVAGVAAVVAAESEDAGESLGVLVWVVGGVVSVVAGASVVDGASWA